MPVAAMFQCKEVVSRMAYGDEGEAVNMEVKLEACIHGPGNEDWSKWTPAGELTMTITNPEVVGFFAPGKDYRIVMTERQPQKARGGAEDNLAELDADTSG